MGAHQHATAVFDVDAIGLADIVTNLNSGLDIGGNAMGSQTALLLGVGANPGALNIDEEVRRFERKVEAGAEYVVTQPVFDIQLLENFLKRIEHCRIPVVCGIWPLTSYRNAQFMVDELRVPVPEPFMERMRQAADAEAARREGIAIAQEMTRQVQWMVEGIQLSAPFGRYQMAVDVAAVIEKK
jgi:homocysteine S-methyltransferase